MRAFRSLRRVRAPPARGKAGRGGGTAGPPVVRAPGEQMGRLAAFHPRTEGRPQRLLASRVPGGLRERGAFEDIAGAGLESAPQRCLRNQVCIRLHLRLGWLRASVTLITAARGERPGTPARRRPGGSRAGEGKCSAGEMKMQPAGRSRCSRGCGTAVLPRARPLRVPDARSSRGCRQSTQASPLGPAGRVGPQPHAPGRPAGGDPGGAGRARARPAVPSPPRRPHVGGCPAGQPSSARTRPRIPKTNECEYWAGPDSMTRPLGGGSAGWYKSAGHRRRAQLDCAELSRTVGARVRRVQRRAQQAGRVA